MLGKYLTVKMILEKNTYNKIIYSNSETFKLMIQNLCVVSGAKKRGKPVEMPRSLRLFLKEAFYS